MKRMTIVKSISIILLISLFLSACGIKPPEVINWNTPVASPDISQVNPDEYIMPTPIPANIESDINKIPTYPVPQELITDASFCDGDSQHECFGDESNGWRGIYSTDYILLYVQYFIFGKAFSISYSGGEIWLSCSGVGGDEQKVTEGFVNNLREKISEVREKQDTYEKASQDAASGVGWAIGGGAVGCVLAIVGTVIFTWIFPPADAITLPGAVGACGVGGVTGIVGGAVGAGGQGNAQTSCAKLELENAEKDLQDLVHSMCSSGN